MKNYIYLVMAGIITLPFLISSVSGIAEAKSYRLTWHCKAAVSSTARASGTSKSYNTKKRIASLRARRKWGKVAWRSAGFSYRRWRSAQGKSQSCEGAAGSVYCTVTARPCKKVRRAFGLKLKRP